MRSDCFSRLLERLKVLCVYLVLLTIAKERLLRAVELELDMTACACHALVRRLVPGAVQNLILVSSTG